MGANYNIADISPLGSVRNLIDFYEAREILGFDRFLHVRPWLASGGAARLQVMAITEGLLVVELTLRGLIRERTSRLGFRPPANELARREPLDLA